MKQRQIYYRRKLNSILIEGKTNKKTVAICTLPSNPINLIHFLLEKSFFTQEKAAKINEKISRLDYRPEKESKQAKVVSTRFIGTTLNKDAVLPKNGALEGNLRQENKEFDITEAAILDFKKRV